MAATDINAIAMLTNKTFLLHGTADEGGEMTFTKFVDITKYPQLGGEPEQVEVTTLSDTKKRYISGLEDTQKMEFGANYTVAAYKKVYDLQIAGTVEKWRLAFGDEEGSDGLWEWEGRINAFISEGESGAARAFTFTISDEGEEPLRLVDPTEGA